MRALQPERLSRLVQTLSNLICHQIEASEPSPEIIADVVTPWILLANLIESLVFFLFFTYPTLCLQHLL